MNKQKQVEELAKIEGAVPCRDCGEMFFPPKGLYYGDPTLCRKCGNQGGSYSSEAQS